MASLEKSAHGFGFAVEYSAEPGIALPEPRRMNRTAIGAGLAAALISMLVLMPQISAVFAGNDSGSGNFFLQETKGRAAARPALFNLGAAAVTVPEKPQAIRAVGGARLARGAGQPLQLSGAGLGNRSVCVRLCDGFFFPVGDVTSNADVEAQENTCTSLCPGAPARLYLMPAGSDNIDEAVSVREKRPYSALPVAFRHASTTDRTCSCHAERRSSSVALLQDFTLRKGDGVMTPKGIKVFRGAQHWPYKRNDFLSLAETRDVTVADKGALGAIERAAKGLRPLMTKARASTPVPAGKSAAAPVSTRRDAKGNEIRVVGPQAFLAQ